MRWVVLTAVLLAAACARVQVREEDADDGKWTPPPARREEPAQVTDPACPNRALLVRGECRANSDCLYECVRDVERRQYGDCACPEGKVCERWYGGAAPGGGQACVPGCQTRGAGLGGRPACLADERCADSGRCEALRCDQEFPCAAGGRCAVGDPGADVHGCVAAACGTDADCPCPGYCVLGRCQARGGRCEHPRA